MQALATMISVRLGETHELQVVSTLPSVIEATIVDDEVNTFHTLKIVIATVVLTMTVLFRAGLLNRREVAVKKATRSVETQTMTTYLRNISTPRFQFLNRDADHGAWVEQWLESDE